MSRSFDVQGHRGCRGLKPENTFPAFETALDLQVTTLEFDLHLSKDGVPIICHDPRLSPKFARLAPGSSSPDPTTKPLISRLTCQELRGYWVDKNPEPQRFVHQNAEPTPVAEMFCKERGLHVYGLPALDDFFDFVEAYAGSLGERAGKNADQRQRARSVRFNMEIKRVPYYPVTVADGFNGSKPAIFEKRIMEMIRTANVQDWAIIQSFDHRSLRVFRQLEQPMEPQVTMAALIAGMVPANVVQVLKDAGAQIYSSDFAFLDRNLVKELHDANYRVIPFTVNEVEDMQRMLDWEVDGMITDYPDRLIPLVQARHWWF
jgi:glycerophosphoryl diester phosphodiesterase